MLIDILDLHKSSRSSLYNLSVHPSDRIVPLREVMPTHKGFTAIIYDAVNGLPFPEYCPSVNTLTDTITCYIETRAEQAFTIVLRDNIGQFSQGTAVYVDGMYVDNGLTGPGVATERKWFGKRIDHIRVKPFIFRRNSAGMSMK